VLLQRLPAIFHFGAFFALLALETWRPRQPIPVGRLRHIGRHLSLDALNLPIYALLGLLAERIDVLCQQHRIGLLYQLPLPFWAQLTLGLVLLDLCDYWFHRLEHLLPWLWRFHRVHHTDRSPDATTSLRTHPVALVCLSLFMEGGSILIGTPLSVLLLYSGIAAAVSHWQHANVELHSPRTERVLSLLVNPPRVHRRHHSREPGDAHSNFSDVLSIWDRLFGTYRGPSSAPVQFGVSGHDDPPAQTLLGMLRSPLSRSP